MPTDSVGRFIRLLKKSPGGPVFNPWWQVDKENDVDHSAPAIRRRHLRAYLCKRLGKTEFVVIGEALGYRGGHFSGIPMTSERILLGKRKTMAFSRIMFFRASNQLEQAGANNVRMVFQSRQQRSSGAHCLDLA
jgi:hypothetical protein